MDSQLSVLLVFGLGLATFISPCVLPLLPSYLTFITGMSFEDLKEWKGKAIRRATVLHSVFFILGFTLVFLAMGVVAAFLGEVFTYLLLEKISTIRIIAGAIIILLGIFITGIVRVSFLDMEKRIHLRNKPIGFLGSSLVGITFAAGWSPCFGPILANILLLVVIGPNSPEASETSINPAYGILLLFAYSMGLGLPFFLSSLAFNTFLSIFKRFKRFIPIVNVVCGIILIAVGVFLIIQTLIQF